MRDGPARKQLDGYARPPWNFRWRRKQQAHLHAATLKGVGRHIIGDVMDATPQLAGALHGDVGVGFTQLQQEKAK